MLKRKSILSLVCLVCLLALQPISADACGSRQTRFDVLVNGVDVTITYYYLQAEEEVGAKVVYYNKEGQVVGEEKEIKKLTDLYKTNVFHKKFTNDAAKYGEIELTLYYGNWSNSTRIKIADFHEEEISFPVDPQPERPDPTFPPFPMP